MKIKSCWALHSELRLFPILIRITNPENHLSTTKSAIMDTGYSGYCGLDSTTIRNLNLPKLGSGKGYTVMGEMEYENFLGMVEIITPEQTSIKKIKILKEDSAFLENQKEPFKSCVIIQSFKLPLLGTKTISQSDWILLPSKNLVCMLDED